MNYFFAVALALALVGTSHGLAAPLARQPMPRLAARSAVGRHAMTAARHTVEAPASLLLRPTPAVCRASFAIMAVEAAAADEMPMVKETAVRSFVKAAGWRFTAGIVTACSSYFFTGSLAMAASIVGWDLFSKSGTMFIGERLWNNVKW